MRMRKKPWAETELNLNPHAIKGAEKWKGNWNKLFENSNPIFVELGCGKGNFIIGNANLNNNINYIGIEQQISVIAIAAKKLRESELKNVKLIHGDVNLLTNYFENGEIQRIYINFCDPWPKKRWVKRRLTYENFLKLYINLIGVEGEIHFKTDNKDLFEFSLNELCKCDFKLKNISLDLHKKECEGNIMTEYEQKFSSQDMPIYRCEAIVTPNSFERFRN